VTIRLAITYSPPL